MIYGRMKFLGIEGSTRLNDSKKTGAIILGNLEVATHTLHNQVQKLTVSGKRTLLLK